MSSSTESCHIVGSAESDSRQNVCSPASSYSTFSREVKYIFNPSDDSRDEYMDYSHIGTRSKQHYMSHTPRTTISAASQQSGKENRTLHGPRNERVFDPIQHEPSHCGLLSRTGSLQSGVSRDRGPISPSMEETLYSTTHGYGCCKQNVLSDHGPEDRTYFSPASETTSNTHGRHSYPVWNSMPVQLHAQSIQKSSDFQCDMYNRHARNCGAGPGLNTLHNQHLPTNVHSSHHYQQPNIHHAVTIHPPHPQEPSNHSHDAPYPLPPRYNYQQHSRRKTWSPPALKVNLSDTGQQDSRVCCSNDSLDAADESGIDRRQSLLEELNMTPPKLAPVSGVLPQNPGQNLIRPIAYKPVHANPSSLINRRQPEADDNISGSHETARLHGMKPGTRTLGMQESPDSQNSRLYAESCSSTSKRQHHNSSGSTLLSANSNHDVDTASHSQPLTVYPNATGVDSSHNISQHNLSTSSHNSVFHNSHNSIPFSCNTAIGSSHLSVGDETSLSSEFPSDTFDSVLSLNISRVSSRAVEGVLQTPSPSDSGVGELEAMLREKDAEINILREVMDRNERAIFQVYEERRNMWLHETQELQNEYERRLKVQSRKSYKTEQVLSLQVYKLQQEQKTLQDEKAMIINERDVLKQQVEESNNLIAHLKQKLEAVLVSDISSDKQMEDTNGENGKINKESLSLQEELAMKNKELITLKSQLQSFQTDMEKKNKELAEKVRDSSAKTEEVKALKVEIHRLRSSPTFVETSAQTCVPSEVTAAENMKPSLLGERDRLVSSLQEELAEIQAEVLLLKEEQKREREQWQDEKNKVIRYQKQLQLNYVQMQRKNIALEAEVEQLTLELESRDMKLIALNGEESVC